MGTYLEIVTVTKDAQGQIHYPAQEQYECLTLSEAFLYGVIVNEEALSSYLSPVEIQAIRPNWGEISLRPTSSLSPDKRETYLSLLKDVMRTNNNQPLQEFLIAEGIISVALNDMAKEPTAILEIIKKIEGNLVLCQVKNHGEVLIDFFADQGGKAELVETNEGFPTQRCGKRFNSHP